MIPFALFFPYAYRATPYVGAGPYKGGFLGIKALIQIFNPMEILRAIKFAFSMATDMRKQGDQEEYLVAGGSSYSPPTAPPYTYHNLEPVNVNTAYDPAYGQPYQQQQQYQGYSQGA